MSVPLVTSVSYTAPVPAKVIPSPVWFANPAPAAAKHTATGQHETTVATITDATLAREARTSSAEASYGGHRVCGTCGVSAIGTSAHTDLPANQAPSAPFFLSSSSGTATYVPTLGTQAILVPATVSHDSSTPAFFLHAGFVPMDVVADLTLPPW